MASGSLKDLSKFLNSVFAGIHSSEPLSEAEINEISSFVEKHPKTDDQESQKIHDELLDVYSKHVVGDHEKQGPFVSVLRHLRPVITGDERLSEWWNLAIRPVVDAIGHKRFVVDDAKEFLLKVLVFDEEDDRDGRKAQTSRLFTHRLLDVYLERTKIPVSPEDVVRPEDEYIAHGLETLLITFGRKKPKDLLLALDDLFVRREQRAQALGLLSSFVRVQPPHLHVILETPLVDHLYACLTLDKSTIVVSLALTVLIMIIPHITSSLAPNLGSLFWIYSRLLCWDKYAATERKKALPEEDEICFIQDDGEDTENELGWDRVAATFRNTESIPPDIVHFFTFLYGLFPLNFMKFVRKPKKFLEEVGYRDPDGNEIDSAAIRRRTDSFRRVHLLHPHFYTSDAEDELAEHRWLKSDPADIATECMSLYVAVTNSLDDPGPPPKTKLPDVPSPVRGEPLSIVTHPEPPPKSRWRDTQSTAVTNLDSLDSSQQRSPRSTSKSSCSTSPVSRGREPPDSPTLPPVPQVFDGSPLMVRKASSPGLARDDRSRLNAFIGTVSQSPSPNRLGFSGTTTKDLARLQREVMLLKNDLNFERYLKQQHLSHIGQLQRKHIKEATAEADTQGLINKNRAMKAKLAKSDELYEQLKKETAMSRNQSKKWEADLSTKLKAFREEKKQWVAEKATLETELKNIKQDSPMFSKLASECQGNEVLLKSRIGSLQKELDELEDLRHEVKELQDRLRTFELREIEFEQAQEHKDILRAKLETSRLELLSRDSEIKRMKRSYDHQIAELEAQQRGGHRPVSPESPTSSQLPATVQSMIDSALAANKTKTNRLRDAHDKLRKRYFELEARNQELELQGSGPDHPSDLGRPREGFRTQSALRTRGDSNVSGHALSEGNHLQHRDGVDRFDFEDEDFFREPDEFRSLPNSFPNVSARFESLQHRQRLGQGQVGGADTSPPFGENFSNDFRPARHGSDAGASRGGGARSVISESSQDSRGEKRTSSKIQPKSEVRYFGRGGRQNIGKKPKESKESPEKSEAPKKTSSGFSGSLFGGMKGGR